jgi:methyl-accepting chemotaxis protein
MLKSQRAVLFFLPSAVSKKSLRVYMASDFTISEHEQTETQAAIEGPEDRLRYAIHTLKEDITFFDETREDFERLEKTAEEAFRALRQTEKSMISIQNIAMNVKILGFNASIEANRVKEGGKGFGVIASEVRNLAETTGASVAKISEAVAKLADFKDNLSLGIDEINRRYGYLYDDMKKVIDALKTAKKEIEPAE